MLCLRHFHATFLYIHLVNKVTLRIHNLSWKRILHSHRSWWVGLRFLTDSPHLQAEVQIPQWLPATEQNHSPKDQTLQPWYQLFPVSIQVTPSWIPMTSAARHQRLIHQHIHQCDICRPTPTKPLGHLCWPNQAGSAQKESMDTSRTLGMATFRNWWENVSLPGRFSNRLETQRIPAKQFEKQATRWSQNWSCELDTFELGPNGDWEWPARHKGIITDPPSIIRLNYAVVRNYPL